MCCHVKVKCKKCGSKFEATILKEKMYGKGLCGRCGKPEKKHS